MDGRRTSRPAPAVATLLDNARAGVPLLTGLAADLHLHSTASDGVLPPPEVVRRAAAAGLAAVALTDHDTLAGVPDAEAEARRQGLGFLAGAELSVAAPWGEMHLLLYGPSLDHPALHAFLGSARAARAERGSTMVSRLRDLGVSLSLDDVLVAAAGAPVGRPHVARALIAAGAVGSIEEAFDRFLGRGAPAFVPKRLPPLPEVTRLAREIGAVTSAAHLGLRGSRACLEGLMSQGLDAVEVAHPSHSPGAQAALERTATDLGLLRTGGSDWHGAAGASPSHSTIGAVRVPLAWIEAIREACRRRRPGAAVG